MGIEIYDRKHHKSCPYFDIKDDYEVNEILIEVANMKLCNITYTEMRTIVPLFYINAYRFVEGFLNGLYEEKRLRDKPK